MKNTSKTLISSLLAMLMLTSLGSHSASAQDYRYHRGYHKYHVWRNEHWTWEYHPADWVIPTELVGPAQVDISLGWQSHPGWQRYRVWRHNRWDYVYHPAGWTVPGAWNGPRDRHRDHDRDRDHDHK